MKTRWVDIFSIFAITFLALVFFWKFFLPTPQLLVTPDFGRSDAWHFSFPTKYVLSQNLKQNKLPLWSPKLGGGFPLFAEGQTGALFFPNLVLFRLLDPVIAYNVALMLIPLTIGWGMYVWLRMLGLGPLPSFLGAITLSFSGPVITQFSHITLLQGFSLLPWVMVTTHQLAQKKSWQWIVILSIIISQQLFAGFPQATVITLLFAAGYFVWCTRKIMLCDGIRFGFAILLALGLSAVQILPSFEFLRESTARGGFSPHDAAYFSYPLKHLVTFLDPFRLGNPKLATYPPFTAFDGSIFWENTGYIGILPLVLFAIFLVSFKKGRFTRVFLFFVASLFVSFLLMLGSHSPLYIVYSFWPLNLFRVPSRFLWIFVTSLIVLAAMGATRFTKHPLIKGFLFLCVGANTIFLMKTWRNYHALVPANIWLSHPAVTQFLTDDQRVYTIGSEFTHNQSFLTKGWQDMKPYEDLRGTLAPDSNLLWNISSSQVYAGRFLRRQALVDAILTDLLSVRDNVATVSSQTKKLLDIFSLQQLVSTIPLTGEGLQPVGSVKRGEITINVYTNKESLPRVYLARDTKVAQTFEESVRKIEEETFIPGKSIIVEHPLALSQKIGGDAWITDQSDTTVMVQVRKNPAPAVLVLTDTFYPGWKAYVDDKKTEIFPVNIRHRGVLVSVGDHTVVFRYDPTSLKIGAGITIATLVAIVMGLLLSFATSRTDQKGSLPGLGRLRNPDK